MEDKWREASIVSCFYKIIGICLATKLEPDLNLYFKSNKNVSSEKILPYICYYFAIFLVLVLESADYC